MLNKDYVAGKNITYEDKNIVMTFSTASQGLNYNKLSDDGLRNLNTLKETLGANELIYLNQVHSNDIEIYEGDNSIKNTDGDGIVTNERKTIIGIFTADCVPLLFSDSKKQVIAAVHSGWKGTLNNISIKAIKVMKERFFCNAEDIKVYIGPHNRQCCYEVSDELIELFQDNLLFRDKNICNGRMLNLEECIRIQLKSEGIMADNTFSTKQCTYCSKDYKFYSYRKEEERMGRMFSYVIIN